MSIMKDIYVILTATPTIMGKMIRTVKGHEFNHSSISLTENLSEMYSFARYRAWNPLVGGFVKEFPRRFSLGKNKDVYIRVFKIPVSNLQYNDIKSFIDNIKDDKEENIYNSIDALGLLFGYKYNIYKAYTCSSFVVKTLCAGDIILRSYSSKNVFIDELEKLLNKYTYFNGCIKDYVPAVETTFDTKDFYERTSIIREIARTIHHFYMLIERNIKLAER